MRMGCYTVCSLRYACRFCGCFVCYWCYWSSVYRLLLYSGCRGFDSRGGRGGEVRCGRLVQCGCSSFFLVLAFFLVPLFFSLLVLAFLCRGGKLSASTPNCSCRFLLLNVDNSGRVSPPQAESFWDHLSGGRVSSPQAMCLDSPFLFLLPVSARTTVALCLRPFAPPCHCGFL